MNSHKEQSFTLLEILLVVGAIVILAGIVILAINPSKQLADLRDAQRKVDIGEINKALIAYQIDSKGTFPITFPTTMTEICDTGSSTFAEVEESDCEDYLNLSFLVPKYLVAIPRDPSITSSFNIVESAYAALGGTRYQVYQKNNRFAFWAGDSENKTVYLNLDEEELAELENGDEEEEEDPTSVAFQGEEYPIIQIGEQYWLGKNLNTANYRNGDPITHIIENYQWHEWNNLIGKWSYLNNNESSTLGKLYNWYAINDSRGLCPLGWHIPTIAEWDALETYLGLTPGTKMKVSSSNIVPWDGDNSSGFSALPAGIRWTGGIFSSYGTTYFWSSDTIGETIPARQLSSWNSGIIHVINQKPEGLSVRCIKD